MMIKTVWAALLLCVMVGCGSGGGGNSAATADTLVSLYTPRYANRFEILKGDRGVVIRVKNPWQGAEGVTIDYQLLDGGSESDTTLGAGQIRYPMRRAVCMSSSYVAFLDALGRTSTVVGVSGRDFIFNPTITEANVRDVGYGGNLNYESIVSLRPDAVLAYEVAGENSATMAKLTQMGLQVVYVADYLESSPLGRAEWLVFFGALSGDIDRAIALFMQIEESYNHVGELVAGHMAEKPKVMLNSPYRDTWYMPGDRSYMVRLIEDAGGYYLGRGVDSDVSRPVSSETALTMMDTAQIWLNPGMSTTLAQLKADNPRFSTMPVVRNGMVYNNNARITPMGGSDFWESGAVRPDLVISDLVKIFHPDLMPDHELYYYHRLQ